MKKTRRTFALLGFFLPVLSFLFLMLLLGGLITSSVGGSSGSTTGKRTRLTAQEVAQKANISVERAEDVIKILNWQLSKEKFTLEGSSGSLAVAERESGFDPKLTNPSGGVAGYFQWSGWDGNTINGDRWANASSRTLDSTVQLELMSYELNHGYKKVKDYMQKATDPFESAKYWSEHYEGVSLSDGQTKLEKLEKDGKKWYEVFKGTIEDSSSSGNAIAGSLDIAPGAVAMEIPNGYSIDKEITKEGYITQSYPYGECTWYVFNRAKEFGIQFDPYMGNGQDWAHKSGYEVTNTPTKHSAVSFQGRQAGGHATYGHVAFVEDVKDDGSILISECNFVQSGQQTGITNYRVFGAEEARNFYYVIGK